MQLTKGAIGNLINRYKAVLKKCHLMNTFGSLAVAGMLVMGGAGMAVATDPDVALKGQNTYDSNKIPSVNHLMGGWLVNNAETAKEAHGDIFLTVKGGKISEIIGGSYPKGLAANGDSLLITHGNITTTISGDTTSAEFVVGGSKVAGGAGANLETGDISLTINGGKFGAEGAGAYELVMGGNYLKASAGDVSVENTATAENITVNIGGGEFKTSVTGGSVAHVYGSGDKGQKLSVTDASTSVTITGGTFEQSSSTGLGAIELDPSIIGGGLALVTGEKGAATSTITGNTLVTINGDVTIADKVLGGSLAQGKGATVTIGKEGGTSTSAVLVENVKSVGDLVGGNMTDGDETMKATDVTTTLHGNSSVTVKAGTVKGDVIGGSYARGAGTVTTNGNTSVVFNAANSATVSQAEYIVGGDKVLGNGTATGKITGTSSVTINNDASVTTGAVVGGSFSRATPGTATATVDNSVVTINGGKSIAGVVGGGLAEKLTGEGKATSDVTNTSTVSIKGGTVTNIVYTQGSGKKASSYAAVAGAGFATGEGAAASVENSVVVIDGAKTLIKGNQPDTGKDGYFDKDNAKVVAGGVAVNGGNVNVTNTSLTMKNGTVTGDLVGGNLIDGAGTAGDITSTSVALTDGTLDGEVMGGSYVRGSNTSHIGTTNVLVSGGELQSVDHKAQYVLGGGKALVYADGQAASLTINTTNVTISDSVKVLGGGVIGGSLAKGTKSGNATVNVTKANTTILGGTQIAGVVGGGVAENYGTATGKVSSSVTESQLTISGVTIDALRYGAKISDNGETASKAAVVGGGVASTKGTGEKVTSSVTTANTTINGGTINGHVVAGGLADGGTATVGTANLTINGGTITGSVYAGGAELGGGTADVTTFDVRITGGTITGDVVAGNYTGEPSATTKTAGLMTMAAFGASPASKGGSITIGGGAKIDGKVNASAEGVETNVVIDGADAEVTGGYEGNKDSTLTFNNYDTKFDNTATGFGYLNVAEGSNVEMDNLSTGAKGGTGADKGFFGGNDVTVNGKGTVKATNVNVGANNTLTVADGSTLDAGTLTTANNGKAKTDGLGSTLVIGNENLDGIANSSLSSTAGSEIQFTGLGESVTAGDITDKLATGSTGIVNVGDTKVDGLSELVKDGKVDYTTWTSKTDGITNNELKKATLTGVNSPVNKTGSFGSAELVAGADTLTVDTNGNLTLTGLDTSSNFVSKADKAADAKIASSAMLTLGDNTYAGNKGIGQIEIGDGATLNVLGQSAAAATVNSGAITATANSATVNAKNVTLNVAGNIGAAGSAIGIITADAANIKATGGDITANTVTLKNNGLLAASKDAATGGNITIKTGLSGQGSVVADKTLTLTQGYTGADGSADVLTLQAGEDITATDKDLKQAADGKLMLRAQQGTITAKDISATNVAAKKLTASGDVAVGGGTLNLTGTGAADASKVNSLTLTNGTQASIAGSLELASTGTITVGTGDDTVGGTTLSAQHINLNDGMLLVDSAWGQASSNVAVASMGSTPPATADVIVNGDVGVGQNSYLALGTADTSWLPGVVGNYTKGVGLSKDGVTAALGVYKGLTIDTGKALLVDGSKMDTATDSALTNAVNAVANNSATFGANSLLVVNGANIYGDKAAITFMPTSGGTLTVDNTSRLVVTDAVAGQDYTIVGNVANVETVQGGTSTHIATGGTVWKTEGLSTTTDMISLGDAKFDDAGKKVTTSAVRNDAHTVFPNLSDGMANAVNDLYTGHAGAAGEPRWDYADVNSDQMGVRFLSRATDNRFLGMDKNAAAESIESAARIAFAGAVPQMTKMASDAGTNAVVNRLGFANPADGAQAMDAEGKIVDRNTTGFALWIAPLWQSQHGWGMDADSMDYGFNGNLGGVSLGADYTFENAIRAGITFNIGGGYAESSGGDLSSTDNRMNFWGLGAYAGWNYENFGVMADVSYTSTWNDLKQDVDSRMGMGDLEADVQATAISAGLRAEYLLQTSAMDIIPHIGVRYMSLNTWGYDVDTHGGTVLEGDSLHQDIWTFPIGVTFSKDIALDSGWNFKPSLDFSVIPAAGDIKAKHDVHFTGLPGTYEVETQMMDYLTWQGGVGLELANDNMSIGVNYTLQAGQHTTGHGVFGSFRYEF